MKEEIKVGIRFYYVNEHGKFLRKITWISKGKFEWLYGWSFIKNLKPNPDKKSKVKLILKENE